MDLVGDVDRCGPTAHCGFEGSPVADGSFTPPPISVSVASKALKLTGPTGRIYGRVLRKDGVTVGGEF